MLAVLLVLAAAPQLTVSPTELKLDAKVVLSPIPDDAYLNIPALEDELRARLPARPELHFAPEVTFRLAKRVLFTMATVGHPMQFFVGARGPFSLDPQMPSWAATRVTPGVEPGVAVQTLRAADAGPGAGALFSVADAVTMAQLAEVLAAARDAGFAAQAIAPDTTLDGGTVGLAPVGRLESPDKAAIQKVITAHLATVSRCYETALAAQPGLAGKLVVAFVIGPDGAVVEASAASMQGLSETVSSCILTDAKTWKFDPPRTKGIIKVRYPFVFAEGQAKKP